MKNRSALTLVEMLIMVTVLAVAVALCLGVFVKAQQITAQTAERDVSISLAERGAEAVKAARGDLVLTASILGAQVQDDAAVLTEGEYTLHVRPRAEGYLGLADIWITHDGAIVAEITASYQLANMREVPHEA